MRASAHPCETPALSLFAMQLLKDDEHRSVAEHVSGCSFCLNELAHLQGNLAAFACTVEMLPPPTALRERVLHRVGREKKAAPPIAPVAPQEPPRMAEPVAQTVLQMPQPEEPVLSMRRPSPSAQARPQNAVLPSANQAANQPAQPSLLIRGFLWLGWVAAAGLSIAGWQLYREHEVSTMRIAAQRAEIDRLHHDSASSNRLLETLTDTSARQVLLSGEPASPSANAPQGRVLYTASTGTLVFLANHLDSLPPGRTYELWLIPSDDRPPIPSGTFRPNTHGDASIVLPSLPRGIEAKAFGVTLEEESGAQSPTLPIVMAGQ